MSLKNVFLMETTGNIMRMLGFSEPIAKWFTALNPRADFALAKSFLLWHKATWGGDERLYKIEKKDENVLKYDFASWKREMGQDLAELLKTKPALEKKINVAKTHDDVMEVLNAGMPDTDAEVMIDLGEGWKWVVLTDRHHSKEARQMQHCATDGRGELVSLRDPSNNPHVTMTYNKEENIVYQIKGKQNAVPDEKYWDAITGFFEKTKSQIKDPFIKTKGKDLYAQILVANGQPPPETDSESMKKLLQLISSDIAKQWPWDYQTFIFDNPDLDYDQAEEIEASVGQVFANAGYQMIDIEPFSGTTRVFYHPSNWRGISEDAADRLEEIPAYEDVEHSIICNIIFHMAKEDIVNPNIALRVLEFAQQNAQILNQVYSTLQKVFNGAYEVDAVSIASNDVDNDVDPLDYEEVTRYEGSSGIGDDARAKLARDHRWDAWRKENIWGNNAIKRFGQNYYSDPEYQKYRDDSYARYEAGEEPPEE
jgi:hypothetical protein